MAEEDIEAVSQPRCSLRVSVSILRITTIKNSPNRRLLPFSEAQGSILRLGKWRGATQIPLLEPLLDTHVFEAPHNAYPLRILERSNV